MRCSDTAQGRVEAKVSYWEGIKLFQVYFLFSVKERSIQDQSCHLNRISFVRLS